MDSLDELLADLHSATTHMKAGRGAPIGVFDKQIQSPLYCADHPSTPASKLDTSPALRYSDGSGGSDDYPVAPPLPPPPSQDVIDEVSCGYSQPHSEPLYEPQNIPVAANQQPAKPVQYKKPIVPAGQSTLGANLNELDDLLQDLNSAQLVRDLSRSSSDTSMPSQRSPVVKSPPPTLPKPSPKLHSPKPAVTFNVSLNTSEVDGRRRSSGQGPGASTATRELDDLMESLSQFKVNANMSPGTSSNEETTPTPSVEVKQSELDSMLGNLQSDMKDLGVSVDTKGLCGACMKPVVGQVITALGKIWHTEHFCCNGCQEELGTRSFFERDEMPYCEPCYHRLFAPLCGKCNDPILDKCVTAMDSTWHMECFICNHCGRSLNDEVFHEKDGLPYCRNDYFEMFAPKCSGCGSAIIEDFISTLNSQWHTKCFRCMECHAVLAGGSFYDHEGLPYCETHYYAKRGSLCAGCHKPITGRCITAMFRKFHPEHFVCAFCLKQLNKGTFKEQNDKPYCHPCFVKLFG